MTEKCMVVHCKKSPFDVYIGRPSPWGNPFDWRMTMSKFVPTRFRAANREDAIAKYEAWVREQPELVARIRRELRGKVLGCFCKPHFACHGEVLVRIANE